jgi:hypothetical protein
LPRIRDQDEEGQPLVLLVNHLKSKGYGPPRVSSALRETQARRVASIYRSLLAKGETNIVVLGDFNDFPDSPPLHPLLANTNLKDISTRPAFTNDGLQGTFGRASAKQKFDYLLLSPILYAKVTAAPSSAKASGAKIRTRQANGRSTRPSPNPSTPPPTTPPSTPTSISDGEPLLGRRASRIANPRFGQS